MYMNAGDVSSFGKSWANAALPNSRTNPKTIALLIFISFLLISRFLFENPICSHAPTPSADSTASRGVPSSDQEHCAYGGCECASARASNLAAVTVLISPVQPEDPEERPRRCVL